jgi:3' terminal RNA ribose 2'-O-methyltransferase Hen1
MLLTITTTHQPATDLGYLLHKHPEKLQTFSMSFGNAHVFYPEVSSERCSATLLLEVDPIGLVRNDKGPSGEGFALENYVNDRPYVSSSFLSVAIAQVYGSALNGTSKDRPELAQRAIPLEVKLPVLSVRGGEKILRELFEPLGYELEIQAIPLDTQFPEWGGSRYFEIGLKHTLTLSTLLSHLYILLPVLDNDKHYWISKEEVEKLSDKGAGWLEAHPMKDLIVRRYLRHLTPFTRLAFERLVEVEENAETELIEEPELLPKEEKEALEKKIGVHQERLETAVQALIESGANSVLDLGCGEGKLLRLLLKEKQFSRISGMDISFHTLQIAADRLKLDRMSAKQKERLHIFQSSLTYRDKRLEGFDAAAVVEVIEHLDPPRLEAFERCVFEFAKPNTVVLTTPNAEYNVKFESLPSGKFRHNDHRFEWTRSEFESWANMVCEKFAYTVRFEAIGQVDEILGGISQMAVFTKLI